FAVHHLKGDAGRLPPSCFRLGAAGASHVECGFCMLRRNTRGTARRLLLPNRQHVRHCGSPLE
ncbi:MAG TPA: hypothetical protein VHD89_04160, partial [Rhodanobacteraceae bacterium]|nr:hypothetical protein [Rhodanobacteraceae bacterium]